MYCSKDAGCCNLCHSEEMLWPSVAGWRERLEVSSLTGMTVPKGQQREQAASASATDKNDGGGNEITKERQALLLRGATTATAKNIITTRMGIIVATVKVYQHNGNERATALA